MSLVYELFIHPLCPFAQRALYLMSFKQIPCTIHEVDLTCPSESFLQANPSGTLPTLKITSPSQTFFLSDSLVISEYFESLPGPALYPRLPTGERNPVEKAIIDLNIANKVDGIKRYIGAIYYSATPTEREVQGFKKAVQSVDQMVENGRFFGNKILNRDEITYIDVIAFPILERVVAFKDLGLAFYNGTRIENILLWYRRMSEFGFIRQHVMPLNRYVNLRKFMQAKKYEGLKLPVTVYDTDPRL
jgi:glutathione S-transferase